MRIKQFQLCTVSNDLAQYEVMKDSFIAGGFDEDECAYSMFDNSLSNTHDPYHVINAVLADAVEPYIIFCHQDVLLEQGHGMTRLIEIIEGLNVSDPSWAVLGNAGVTEDHKILRRLKDPMGDDCISSSAPERVCTLDENFLVVKSSSRLHCSSNSGGFHLYAADLCLQAVEQGYSCYVISFHLTHLSIGKIDQSFQDARREFQKRWSDSYRFRYVHTPCTSIFLSRNVVVRRFFSSSKVTRWLFSNPRRHKLLCQLSDHRGS